MGRVALACLGIAAALAGATTPLAGASSQPPRTALQSFACHRSSDSLNRWIQVIAVMRPISGTERMAMKFELLQREPHSRAFADVPRGNTDLGTWKHPTNPPTLGSRPGDHWNVKKVVVNLSAPAVYKFRVSFRWFDSNGKSLGTVVRQSQLCNQY
jgi:hypothetical protein